MNNQATGVLVVHCAPRALCSHVEWTVNAVVGQPQNFQWKDQPLVPEFARVQVYWEAPVGTAARLASELRGWVDLRFEVTEDPTRFGLGLRIAHTPALGLNTVTLDALGNVLVTEHQVEAILQAASGDVTAVREGFDSALGNAWERELEPYRAAQYDQSIRLLRGVG